MTTEETIHINMPDYTISWRDVMDPTGQCWFVETKNYFDGREEITVKSGVRIYYDGE